MTTGPPSGNSASTVNNDRQPSTKPPQTPAETRFRRQSTDKKKKTRLIEPYRPFPVHCFPDAVSRFVIEASQSIGCDPSFVSLVALAVLGSAIGNTRRLRMKRSYFVPPIIWSVIVGLSGQKKTPALSIVTRRLHERQVEALKEYRAALSIFQEDQDRYNAALKKWQRDSEGERPQPPQAPVRTRHLIGDLTLEALAPILAEIPRGVLIERDELSTFFSSMDRYAKSGKVNSDAGNWLSAYNATHMMIDRKTDRQSIYVPSAFVCITGGIQPAILQTILHGENTENGMAARLLCAYPPRSPNIWTEDEIAQDTLDRFDDLIDDLLSLDFRLDRNGEPQADIVFFTDHAKARYVDFHNRNGREQVALPESLAAIWSKRAELAARVALIIHQVRFSLGETQDAFRLDVPSMEAAIEIAEWSKSESMRMAGLLSEDEDEQGRRELATWIEQKGGQVTASELQRGRRDVIDSEDAEMQLRELVEAGFGSWQDVPPSDRGGRPTRAFVLRSDFTSIVYETPVSAGKQQGFVDTEDAEVPF